MSKTYYEELKEKYLIADDKSYFFENLDLSKKIEKDSDAEIVALLQKRKDMYKDGVMYEKDFELRKSKPKNPFKKLHYATDHIPFYHEFSSIVGLYGRHYIPIIKLRYYQLIGGVLQKNIKIGSIFTDTRVQACYPLPTEGGKNDLIYAFKSLLKKGIKKSDMIDDVFKVSEPISFHQESLIGKSVERTIDNPKYLSGEVKSPKKVKQRIENRGHLDNDFIEFDECNQLINSDAPDFKQAREYLSKAENPLGRNKVEKRSVDDLPEEAVQYFPNSTHSYYFQPHMKLPESFVLQGFGRRKLIPIGNVRLFLNIADENLYASKLEDTNFSMEDYSDILIQHLQRIRKKYTYNDFVFTEKAKEMIKDYAIYLSGQAQIHSEKIYNFSKISKWTSLNNLIRFSAIISANHYLDIVDENCVALAFMDLVEFNQNTYDFIYEKIMGDFDYGVTWNGANYKEKECLKFLYDKRAMSLDSSKVSINDFINEVVCPVYKVKEGQGRNKYLDMKKKGLVDSDQIGRNETRVWLKINPDEHKKYIEGDKGYKGYTIYNNIFLSKKDILSSIKSLEPLKPLKIFEKEKEIDFDSSGIGEGLENA